MALKLEAPASRNYLTAAGYNWEPLQYNLPHFVNGFLFDSA